MRELIFLLLCAIASVVRAEAGSINDSGDPGALAGEKLIWSDEFDTLDPKKWTHLVTAWDGGNREMQYYRNNRTNSFAKDGKLFIRPTLVEKEMPDLDHGKIEERDCNMVPCQSAGGAADIVSPVYSARIVTRYKFSFKYGRVVVKAKMPSGDWIWPAVWMMPEHQVFGQWPRSGEIDIIELRGNKNLRSPGGYNHGNDEVGSTLHFGPAWNKKVALTRYMMAPKGKTWAEDFHTYEFNWTPDQMNFSVDGEVFHEINIPKVGFTGLGNLGSDIYRGKAKNTPFDQKFYFIVNVAVGGEFFPAGWTSNRKPRPWPTWGASKRRFWSSRSEWLKTWGPPDQHSLQIDYIRVYQKK